MRYMERRLRNSGHFVFAFVRNKNVYLHIYLMGMMWEETEQ